MIRVNFHLTEKQLADLRRLSQTTGLTVAELIRRAVDVLLEGETRRGKRDAKPD